MITAREAREKTNKPKPTMAWKSETNKKIKNAALSGDYHVSIGESSEEQRRYLVDLGYEVTGITFPGEEIWTHTRIGW